MTQQFSYKTNMDQIIHDQILLINFYLFLLIDHKNY